MFNRQLVSGGQLFLKGGDCMMDLFQIFSVLFAFGMFILTLLNYIEKRK
ncbi:putative holin-like toxin [Cohnella nanjingensis]